MKPILVISCSDNKATGTMPAIELYRGGMYELIAANCPDVLDKFEVLILSAKHGLIEARTLISEYDTRMPSRKHQDQIAEFAAQHREAAYRTLLRLKEKGRAMFVVMTLDYIEAFDQMTNTDKFQRLLATFNLYVSRSPDGIGTTRGRLKRVLLNANRPADVTHYRSGVANVDEVIGYLNAGQAIGSSLAYFSAPTESVLFHYLRDALKRGTDVFLDNGVITAIRAGQFVSTDTVFERYREIVGLLGRHSKRLSIVVPDHPTEPAAAIGIIERHQADIRWLSKRCRVILPIHKTNDIKTHAKAMLKTLGRARVTIGVPCKANANVDGCSRNLRLSITDINRLLEIKNADGTAAFDDVHFLGLSEKTRGDAYVSRMQLASLYGVKTSCDACRTTAIFGAEKTSNRAGSRALREVDAEFTQARVTRSSDFQAHSQSHEHDYPVIFDSMQDAIESDVSGFVERWNRSVSAAFNIDIDDLTDEEAQEHVMNVICSVPSAIEHQVFCALKGQFWTEFQLPEHSPSTQEKRSEAIARLFTGHKRDAVQIRMQL